LLRCSCRSKSSGNLVNFDRGRLYVTVLSIYMLEVYYRHLPIYANVYSDLRKSGRTDGR